MFSASARFSADTSDTMRIGSPAALASVIANGSGLSSPGRVGTAAVTAVTSSGVLGVAARRERHRDRRRVQQRTGDRADGVATEEPVPGAADHDQVRVLLLGEVDQRLGEGLTDGYRGFARSHRGRPARRPPWTPTARRARAASSGTRPRPGGRRAVLRGRPARCRRWRRTSGRVRGQCDAVVAGGGRQIPDGQMHCGSCSFGFSRHRAP